jgi:hypothetical protein
MDPTAPPPALPDPARRLIGWLIAEAEAVILRWQDLVPPAAAWRRLGRILLDPAEALLRRCLFAMAAGLETPPSPARGPAQARKPAGRAGEARRETAPRPPAFRLGERPARSRPRHLPAALAPRISVPGLTPMPAARAPAPAPDPEAARARLLRRLQALSLALEDPLREAHRLARRLQARPLKVALALVRIPGAASPLLDPPARALLEAANREAATVIAARLAAPPDTS